MTFDLEKTVSFVGAVRLDRLNQVKQLLADPECDVAHKNGAILLHAIESCSINVIFLLAKDARFNTVLQSKELCEKVVGRRRWETFCFIVERQSNCNTFIKTAYRLLQKEIRFGKLDTEFEIVFALKPVRAKTRRKQLFDLIGWEVASISIGLASLNLPCLLLTSLVEHTCQPWCHTVNDFDIWKICSTVLHANVMLKAQTKDKIVATKKRLRQLEQEYQFLDDWACKLHRVEQ